MSLYAQIKVLAFAGSSSTQSINKKLVLEAAQMAHELGGDVQWVDLKDYSFPIYNADDEAENGMPEQAKAFRNLMIHSQVILIASPEYNGSLSPLLKNALDWASRSEIKGPSREAFKGKTFLIMSASPSKSGGARGLVHLKEVLENIGGTVTPQSFSLPHASQAFDELGRFRDAQLAADLKNLLKTVIHSE